MNENSEQSILIALSEIFLCAFLELFALVLLFADDAVFKKNLRQHCRQQQLNKTYIQATITISLMIKHSIKYDEIHNRLIQTAAKYITFIETRREREKYVFFYTSDFYSESRSTEM